MTLKALLFDVDGTLVDTERDGHRVAFNLAFADAGLDWNWDVALYHRLLAVTGGKERIKFYITDFLQNFICPEADEAAWITGLHKAKTAHFLRMAQAGEIPFRPGVKRLILAAREAGFTLGVATTTTPENVTYLLNANLGEGSIEWFDVIAAGDMVSEKKPAPDVFNLAMARLGLTPDECIAFEDSGNGVKSSVAAGLKTIVTITDYTAEDDFSKAAIVLDNMGEPDVPFEVVSGDAHGHDYLDLALVQKLHQS